MTTETHPIKRKLIEVALPLEAINVAAAREGYIYRGNPSAVHKWWAQRPLAACRAVLFASLVDDPSSNPDHFPTPRAQEEERERLFGIIERLVQWENMTSEAIRDEARVEIDRCTASVPPVVLDPFCGGGSIPLEAQRLGLEVRASDLNPVAVLLTKALIEFPARFANRPPVHPDAQSGVAVSGSWQGSGGLADDVRRYGAWMRHEASRRIGHLYPKVRLPKEQGGGEVTTVAWLWARTITCPNPACGARMPLARSFQLSTKKGKEISVEPVIAPQSGVISFEVCTDHRKAPAGTVSRSGARCIVCNAPVPLDYVRSEGQAGRMGAQLLAIVAEGARGRIYLPADPTHVQIAESAKPSWLPDQLLPDEALGFRVQNYGMTRWSDLFTARQLVALTTMTDLVVESRERVFRDALDTGMSDDGISLAAGGRGASAYADAVATYLMFAVDKTAEYNATVVAWNALEDRPKSVFTRQAISMIWDSVELNPLGEIGGTLWGSINVVSQAIPQAAGSASARVMQMDARLVQASPNSVLVSTDPPYYDNVPYADLSDFFYVWLRHGLGHLMPDLFSTLLTPKAGELVADAARHGGREGARLDFETGLVDVFRRLAAAQDDSFPMSIYYAYKQTEAADAGPGGPQASAGWESVLEAILKSGLCVTGTWPIRTERVARSRSVDSNALASSVVLVCRRRSGDAGITTRRDFVACLKRELPDALRTLQHGNIAPVDLAQASIGPGMAVFSRYARVLEPDGSEMRVRMALALINSALDEILTEQEGEFDADTRWAIAWYEQFGLDSADSGRAILLCQAKNTSLDGLQAAGIVDAPRGKTRLLARSEYSANWDPATDGRLPVWEATQRLVQALLTGGEGAAAEMQAKLGGLGEKARDLAYRLYQVAERKGWVDEARAYNALVVAWPDLLRGAEPVSTARPSQPSLGLE